MRLHAVEEGGLRPIPRGRLAREELVESWIAEQPQLLSLDLLVIGRQVTTEFGGKVDLLALDPDGDVVVIELKRDTAPREVVAQILDYASWVSTLTTRQVHDLALAYLRRPLSDAFLDRFGVPLPETLNAAQTLLVVASEFDASSERIVRYLSEVHDVAINTAFFSVFEDGGRTLVATDWLLDQVEVVERQEAKRQAPWSGLWFVNAGEGPHRAWADMRRYGFVAAGGGRVYSGALDRLKAGDTIAAYQKDAGYVGLGTVTGTALLAKDFITADGPLLEQPLEQPALGHDRDDPERAEYVVPVRWTHTVPRERAVWEPGLFANQHVVCKLRDPRTADAVRKAFERPR